MSTRKAVFLSFVFFLFVLVVPQLCAQNNISMSPSEAAVARKKLVDYSKQYIGKPYMSGGIGPNAFDCSGLIFTVSRESIGVQLPRTTQAIFSFCKDVSDKEREAGDLVFFKTTSSGNVSHVGLYIGSNQFIHAASDGPNTGVIISSLKESYWKSHYFCTRRYLPSSNSELLADKKPADSTGSSTAATSASKSTQEKTSSLAFVRNDGDSFLQSLIVDVSASFDWSFFTPDYFRLNARGFDTMVHARYAGKNLQPGLGTYIRYDSGTENFQFPLVLTLTLNEFCRVFAGPVISVGKAHLPDDSDEKIKNSFFPGILGFSFSTPSVKIGKTFVSIVQDIHYTVFNDRENGALSFGKSVTTGLVLASGIRVTLPLKSVL
ncbi:MAG: C40 family peptidase [Treponema sp.]|uniref:C40 family peptidase n=1 Tax=Treponema sp. TaxID=166 RepID=UPI0025D5CB10|nr:C40 family peptidase [Treponema sp.]MBQ9282804.1 C40 family peptidase [Treponema sp.]